MGLTYCIKLTFEKNGLLQIKIQSKCRTIMRDYMFSETTDIRDPSYFK